MPLRTVLLFLLLGVAGCSQRPSPTPTPTFIYRCDRCGTPIPTQEVQDGTWIVSENCGMVHPACALPED